MNKTHIGVNIYTNYSIKSSSRFSEGKIYTEECDWIFFSLKISLFSL